jgi:hypothetical protein
VVGGRDLADDSYFVEFPMNNKNHLPDAIRQCVRVGGGCGPLYLNGPEVDCLFCQWGGCAPYWGPKGVLIQYINMLKK